MGTPFRFITIRVSPILVYLFIIKLIFLVPCNQDNSFMENPIPFFYTANSFSLTLHLILHCSPLLLLYVDKKPHKEKKKDEWKIDYLSPSESQK